MTRVVVLGSSGYDLTIQLQRLPRSGETLLGGKLLRGPGGKGANAAIAARRAGAEVMFLTCFGGDDFGRSLMNHDLEEGLDLSYAKTILDQPNQVALILVGEAGENLIAVAPGASQEFRPADIEALPDSAFDGEVFLTSLELPIETVAAGLQRARNAGMITILNPAPAAPGLMEADFMQLVDIITPNQEESALLSGRVIENLDQAAEAGNLLKRQFLGDIVLTLGESGCLVLPRSGDSRLIPTPRVKVVDTVGAGDVFNGALAVAIAENRNLHEAATWACIAGALAVTQAGAQGSIPKRSEIDRFTVDAR